MSSSPTAGSSLPPHLICPAPQGTHSRATQSSVCIAASGSFCPRTRLSIFPYGISGGYFGPIPPGCPAPSGIPTLEHIAPTLVHSQQQTFLHFPKQSLLSFPLLPLLRSHLFLGYLLTKHKVNYTLLHC